MVIVNVDIKDSIVNGSLGTVIDFIKTDSGNDIRLDYLEINDKTFAMFTISKWLK